MKTITKIIFNVSVSLLIGLCLINCSKRDGGYEKSLHNIVSSKIVVSKKEEIGSHTSYKYNILTGKMCLVPSTKTYYYVLFSDHTHKEVDMDTYMFANAGDTMKVESVEYY